MGVGVAAGAVYGVVQLWDWFFPRDDVADVQIEATVARRVMLDDHLAAAVGYELRLPEASTTARRNVVDAVVVGRRAAGPGVPQPATDQPTGGDGDTTAPATEEPTGGNGATTTPATEDPTGGGEETTDPATPPDEGEEPTDQATDEPTGAGLDSLGIPAHWPPSEDFVSVVRDHPSLIGWDLGTGAIPLPALVHEPVGTDEDELAPEELAEEFSRALEHVESRVENGRRKAIGWEIYVNLRVEGLRGEPLFLTWSLDGQQVPESWAVENFQYRLIAEERVSTGSPTIWVPELRGDDAYRVNINVADGEGVSLRRQSVALDQPAGSTGS